MAVHSPLNAFSFNTSLIEIGHEIKLLEHLKKNWITLYIGWCIMKNLWCCSILIFHTILINDMSNKIVLNGLQFKLIQYLSLSSVFDKR
jgi:hypothetical protein